jgi:hypothetical protein
MFTHTVCLCDQLHSQKKMSLLTYTALNFAPYNSKAVCFLGGRTEFLNIGYLYLFVLNVTKINQCSS